MTKIIVALSGGMDSTTLFAAAVACGGEVIPVTVRYGSKHNDLERRAAANVAGYYGLDSVELDLTGVFRHFRSDLLASGAPVPEGHYQEESMRRTVVPFRNGILIASLAGFAESVEADQVWVGVHAGDHFIYPDCRPPFVYSMIDAVLAGTNEQVRLRAPFLHHDKKAILDYGLCRTSLAGLGKLVTPVPYHLTRTCYTSDPVACGRCGACQERLEAHHLLGVIDPLEYQSRELLPKGVGE